LLHSHLSPHSLEREREKEKSEQVRVLRHETYQEDETTWQGRCGEKVKERETLLSLSLSLTFGQGTFHFIEGKTYFVGR